MIKILIIDDHEVIVEGIRSILLGEKAFNVVDFCTTGDAALNYLSEQLVDLILLDINLPDCSGIDLCRQIKQLNPSIHIIGLSTFSQSGIIGKMLENGASGYVMKNATSIELLSGIDAVFEGKLYLSEEAEDIMRNSCAATLSKSPVLTRREKQVLELVASGLTNPEIADSLFISQTTVISHRKSLLEKTESKNTAQLVKYCFENGML